MKTLHSRKITILLLITCVLGVGLVSTDLILSGLASRRSRAEKNINSIPISSVKLQPMTSRGPRASLKTCSAPFAALQGCTLNCTATVPASGTVGAGVPFQSTATPSNCGTVTPTFFWDFGDGTTSTQQNPSKVYNASSPPGGYTWTLTTTVGAGLMIDTIVGGPGEDVPARQASFGTIGAIARDPQNRGVYIADATEEGTTFIRFLNTGASPVTLGGRTIAAGTVRAIAGGGGDFTTDNISAFQADVGAVTGLAVSTGGDLVYFIDKVGGTVRAVNVSTGPVNVRGASTGAGNVRTLASGTDFPQFPELFSLTTTSNGDVFVIDSTVNKVYRIASSGTVATFAGNGASTMANDQFQAGPATNIPLLQPSAVKSDGTNVFIADSGHRRVIRVSGGNATLVRQFDLIASTGSNPFPSGIAIVGSDVYVTNGNEKAIYRASNGGPKIAGITNSMGDPVPCDYSINNCGDGGPALNAGLNLLGSTDLPPAAGLDSDGVGLFVADQRNKGRVRYINLSGGTQQILGVSIAAGAINTIAGSGLNAPYDSGLAKGSELSNPTGVAVDNNGNLWISDTNDDLLRFVNRGDTQVTIFSGTPAVQTVQPGAIVTVNKDRGTGSGDDLPVNQANLDKPQGLFVTSQGVYIVDSLGGVLVPAQSGNDTSLIRFINTTSANVTIFPGAGGNAISVPAGNIMTIAGGGISDAVNGFATAVTLKGVSDIAVASNGTIYVTDVNRKAVRKIDGNTGAVSPLNLPANKEYTGLGFTSDARLLVANFTDGSVHRESVAGGGTFATFGGLGGNLANVRDVAGAAGGVAYAITGTPPGSNGLPTGNHRIVQISSVGGTSVIAGASPGFDGDGGAATGGRLNTAPPKLVLSAINNVTTPETVNIVVGQNGDILFTDTNNNRVRRLSGITCTQTGTITITGNNPAPVLTGINPTSRMRGDPGFTLTATGTSFSPTSVVQWNGAARTTMYVDSTQLTAMIPASDLANAGTASVTVVTPAPGGGTSQARTFTIIGPNPVPTITSLSPTTAPEGSGPITLTVNGTGFVNTSKVRLENAEVPTTFVNATRLTAQLGIGDLIGVGPVIVTVLSPPPGGGVSNTATFTITPAACPNPATNPVPQISVLGPPAVGIGHPTFKLFVTGNSFVCTSKVRINNVERDTTVFGGTMLAATILPSDVASLGNKPITIVSPAHQGMSDGGTSGAVNLRVMPKFTTVSAASFAQNPAPQAPDSIVAGFGSGLASGTAFGTSNPLPTNLGPGTEVKVTDSGGVERQAGLFFVTAGVNGQINYHMPPGTAEGVATAVVTLNGNVVAAGPVNVSNLAPGLFTFPGTGNGVVAGVVIRARPDGTQTSETIFDLQGGTFVPKPINLGAGTDPAFLIVFGTGMKNNSGPANITVDFGNGRTKTLRADFSEGAFAVPNLIALDQVNIFLPPSLLMGAGLINMKVTIDGKVTNTVQFAVQ